MSEGQHKGQDSKLKKSKDSTWIEDLRCGRDAARYTVAYKSIIVMVAQRDLRIISDGVLELPRNSRGEEGGKKKGITQEYSPQHICTVGTCMRMKVITELIETPVQRIVEDSIGAQWLTFTITPGRV